MTASVTMLPEVTARIRPPRALAVPYRLGYPLGAANDAVGQARILRALLALCAQLEVPILEAL